MAHIPNISDRQLAWIAGGAVVIIGAAVLYNYAKSRNIARTYAGAPTGRAWLALQSPEFLGRIVHTNMAGVVPSEQVQGVLNAVVGIMTERPDPEYVRYFNERNSGRGLSESDRAALRIGWGSGS